MVFNRTQLDIDEAKSIRLKIQKGEEITSDEISTLEKGTFTVNALNRIENKQQELYNLFISSGYFCEYVESKEWGYNDIFDENDFLRIIENGEKLRRAFFDYQNSPNQAKALYHFEEINAIEHILYDLDKNYQYMVSNWRECGTFECGGIGYD